MGTQQLLMIVICVIVVAAAIGVGIAMFNQRDFSSNSQAIMAEMQVLLPGFMSFGKLPSLWEVRA
jgi:cell division protein FtsL